ncbi:MAG: hypothetical protein L6R38_005634 [Xanthoria sp. 2 TBL-2021]|nr:MAG: hypothetical protein L6R38_005634 [Xanthoria sp. 2 TBL-2021]
MSDSPNPNEVIPGVIAGAINALSAGAKEPSVKRFVFTSSSTAILIPRLNEKFTNSTDHEKKPEFVLNVVLPNFNMGTILSSKQSASMGAAVKIVYETSQVEEIDKRYGP